MNYSDLIGLLKTRRSIRRFKADPIPEGHVDKIIEAARWAPSGFNSQPWEFIVVKDKELRESIVRIVTEWSKRENPNLESLGWLSLGGR